MIRPCVPGKLVARLALRAGCLLDPDAATNAATPNVAKDARRRQLERGQNSIDRLPMTTGYSSSPSFTSARVSPK